MAMNSQSVPAPKDQRNDMNPPGQKDTFNWQNLIPKENGAYGKQK